MYWDSWDYGISVIVGPSLMLSSSKHLAEPAVGATGGRPEPSAKEEKGRSKPTANLLPPCYNVAMYQSPPIHTDRHKASFNFTLILSIGVVVVGVLSGFEPILIIMGIAFGGFAWLTTPTQYVIFEDRLQIIYGRPRTRDLGFHEVAGFEAINLPFGMRLMIVTDRGRRHFIQPRDPEQFGGLLQDALSRFRARYGYPSEPQPPPESPPPVDPEPPDPSA